MRAWARTGGGAGALAAVGALAAAVTAACTRVREASHLRSTADAKGQAAKRQNSTAQLLTKVRVGYLISQEPCRISAFCPYTIICLDYSIIVWEDNTEIRYSS